MNEPREQVQAEDRENGPQTSEPIATEQPNVETTVEEETPVGEANAEAASDTDGEVSEG
jgi:hypothetical protein